MIKGIIFDMVGPLLQKCPDYVFDALVETAEKIRSDSLNDGEFIQALKKNEITKQYPLEEIAKRIVFKYCKIQQIWDELLPRLKSKHMLGIINNGTAITIPYFKEKNKFDEFFTVFINSSEVMIEKPDGRIYTIASEQMGLKTTECVFIDDTEKNVLGANIVGMKGVLFTNYQNLLADLKSFNVIEI
jgi:HAD superfamily hydrolase (TIGR01509 family)